MENKEVHKNLFLTLMLAIAAVAFWRGVWGVLDVYLFPENYLLSSLISLAIGIIILYIIKPKLKIK